MACELNFASLGEADGWAWVAQKAGRAGDQIVFVRRGDVMALHASLKIHAFDVPTGSPAERIMRAAVKSGFAEELPEDERWRRELILARHASHLDGRSRRVFIRTQAARFSSQS